MDPSFYTLGTQASSEYRAGSGVWLYALLSVVLMLAGGAGIGNMIISGTFPYGQLIVSLGAILLAAPLGFVWYRGFTTRVQVYEHGFAYLQGDNTRTFRWDEIESIWEDIVTYSVRVLIFPVPVGTGYKYTIRKRTGESIKLTSTIAGIDELGWLIQSQVLREMLPRAIETYNNGGSLQFGRLSISRMGINNGKETLPWNQVNAIQIKQGYLIIKKKGKWFRWDGANPAKTPNLFLFVALVNPIVEIS